MGTQAELAEQADLLVAREDLIDRLYMGKPAGRFSLRDVFDCCLQNDIHYGRALDILEGLIAADHTPNYDDFDLRAKAKAMVEAFVDSHPQLIEERADELAEEGCDS